MNHVTIIENMSIISHRTHLQKVQNLPLRKKLEGGARYENLVHLYVAVCPWTECVLCCHFCQYKIVNQTFRKRISKSCVEIGNMFYAVVAYKLW